MTEQKKIAISQMSTKCYVFDQSTSFCNPMTSDKCSVWELLIIHANKVIATWITPKSKYLTVTPDFGIHYVTHPHNNKSHFLIRKMVKFYK
jgi:hypothetical protein